MTYRILSALVVAAGLPLSAAAQEAPADTVRLRFGWTPGMRADVEYEQVRVRNVEGRRDSIRMASTYRMEVDEHPEGLVVRYADMHWTDLPRMEGPPGKLFQALSQTRSGGKAQTVVSPAGEFVRLEGMEPLRQELLNAMQPMIAEVGGNANLQELLRSTLSEEAFTTAAADEWAALVEAWLHADLELGVPYELETSFPSPLGGAEIPAYMTFRATRRLPCIAGEAEARCVELVLENFPDPEALGKVVGEFLQRMGLPAEQMGDLLAQLGVETQVTLVAEPGTLRPHRMQTFKAVSAGESEDKEPARVERSTYLFRYPGGS